MEKESRYKRIIVPVDGSGWSERAIPHATEIARIHNSNITLLHVFRPPAAQYIDQMALTVNSPQPEQLRDQTRQKLISLRNEIRAVGVDCTVELIDGMDPATLICQYINEEGADLVVMSSHGRTGIARLIFGSVARQVIEGISAPVMIIRPDQEQ